MTFRNFLTSASSSLLAIACVVMACLVSTPASAGALQITISGNGVRNVNLVGYTTPSHVAITGPEAVALEVIRHAYGTTGQPHQQRLAWANYTVRGTLDVCDQWSGNTTMRGNTQRWTQWLAAQVDSYLIAWGYPELIGKPAHDYSRGGYHISIKVLPRMACSRPPDFSRLRVVPGDGNYTGGTRTKRFWLGARAAGKAQSYPALAAPVASAPVLAVPATTAAPTTVVVARPVGSQLTNGMTAVELGRCQAFQAAYADLVANNRARMPAGLRTMEYHSGCQAYRNGKWDRRGFRPGVVQLRTRPNRLSRVQLLVFPLLTVSSTPRLRRTTFRRVFVFLRS